MRIAVMDDFKLNHLRNIQIIGRKLLKGLIRNGHDVMPISYRDLMIQFSPFPSKTIARKFGRSAANKFCLKLLSNYQPDILIFVTLDNLDNEFVSQLRDTLKETRFAGWYQDTLAGLTEENKMIISQLDLFMATGGGSHLQKIAKTCAVPAAFIPNPCDPDIEKRYDIPESLRCDVLFTGKVSHKSCPIDATRGTIIEMIDKDYSAKMYGSPGQSQILGLDYYHQINAAKIAVSVNADNSIAKYHSDRLIHYLGCGAFVLASYSPDSDLLFRDKQHLRYFETSSQCRDLLDYYLQNPQERKEISERAMAYAHEKFNCQKISKDILDYIQTGTYEASWAEVIEKS